MVLNQPGKKNRPGFFGPLYQIGLSLSPQHRVAFAANPLPALAGSHLWCALVLTWGAWLGSIHPNAPIVMKQAVTSREGQSEVMLRLERMEKGSHERAAVVTTEVERLREEARLAKEGVLFQQASCRTIRPRGGRRVVIGSGPDGGRTETRGVSPS